MTVGAVFFVENMTKNQGIPVPDMKPTIFLSEKDFPEVKNWEVGSEYKLLVTVKQTSKSIDQYDKKQQVSARFEIVNVKVVDGSDSSKDFNEFEEKYSKKE